MAARRPKLARRIIDVAVDVVNTRAPWLSDQAYRAVATPLQWMDPVAGARSAQARLDDVRARVTDLAARGRIRRVDRQRLDRDLARTREDLERIAPRLPAVEARSLALRVAGYQEALATLPGPAASGRPVQVVDAALATGTTAGVWAGLAPVAGGAAVGGGLAAGAATAVGAGVVRRRRERKRQVAAVAETLAAVDRVVVGPPGVDVRTLDAARSALVRRAVDSGRLDAEGLEALRRIDVHLEGLLVHLLDGDLDVRTSHLVESTITRYLPDTLEPLLAMDDPLAVVRGRPAVREVGDQLAAIEGALAEAAGRPGRDDPQNRLFLQGEFLRSKFGGSSP